MDEPILAPEAPPPKPGRASFASFAPLWVWLVLAGLFGGIVGLGGFTVSYANGLSYLTDNPKACANCHVMREFYDGWNRGSHKHVATCNDCHTPHDNIVAKYAVKALNGFRHSYAFTTGQIPGADPHRAVRPQHHAARLSDLPRRYDRGNQPSRRPESDRLPALPCRCRSWEMR